MNTIHTFLLVLLLHNPHILKQTVSSSEESTDKSWSRGESSSTAPTRVSQILRSVSFPKHTLGRRDASGENDI